ALGVKVCQRHGFSIGVTSISHHTIPRPQTMTSLTRLRPLALSLALALGLMSPLGLQAQSSAGRLPNIGDGNGMSVQQERRLGESIMRQLVTDADYMDDPVLMDYLQTIWQPLRESAMQLGNLQTEQEEAFAWDVFLIRDKSVNAFALPGGFMGVHLGLIAVVSSRDELASVMAHELSHVTQRHIARMQDQQGRSTPFLIAGMILGVLAASRSPDAATAMIMGGTAGSAQGQLNFSRDMEREADRLGFNVHAQAGFDSQGFVGMFQKLQQAARLSDNGNYPYLRSHPLTTERIGDMQARLGLGRTFAPVATSIEHAMMAARARSLMSPYVDDQQKIADTLEKDFAPELPVAKRAAMLYAGVMAYTQQRRAAPAREALNTLLQLVREDPAGLRAAQLLAADTERRLNNPEQCLQALGPKVIDRARVLLQTQCRLDAKQMTLATQASDTMQLWLAQHPKDALAWDLSAQALAQTGERLRSLRADAEFHVVRWDEVGAIDRLRAAQDLAKQLSKDGKLDRAGQMEASIIDSRLRSLERVRRDLLQPQ
ncbi:MAG: hypothetical protein RLZ89_1332, partial [Pseudomonadota bacterium]